MIITMLWKNDLGGSTTSVIVDVPFLTSLEHLTEKADIVAKLLAFTGEVTSCCHDY